MRDKVNIQVRCVWGGDTEAGEEEEVTKLTRNRVTTTRKFDNRNLQKAMRSMIIFK